MAEVAAPIKAKKNAFGKQKEADLIIYKMNEKNAKLRGDEPDYPPSREFPNRDIITWNWGTAERPDWGERVIRWLPGEQSIFVDEQEKNGRIIPETHLNNPKHKFEILQGEIKVRPHEKTKIQFLDICNRNINSQHRTGRIAAVFSRYSEANRIEAMAQKQEKQKEAIAKAFAATDAQIVFQAKYFGIPMTDAATTASRSREAIIAEYRQIAIDRPDDFLTTFDDDDLKMKFYIEKALEDNYISLSLVPGKAILTGSKEEICEIENPSAPADSIFKYIVGPKGEKLGAKLIELNK